MPYRGVNRVQISSDVTLTNTDLAGIMSPLAETNPLSEVELEFSPLALVLLMGDSWPDDWHS
jgi:hypothetical protein